MYSKQSFLKSIDKEIKIITHLFNQLEPEHYNFQPTDGQRTTRELLRYLSFVGAAQTEIVETGSFAPFKAAAEEAEDLKMEDFEEKIKAQKQAIHERIENMTDEELAEDIELMDKTASRMEFLVELVLKNYTAYRMQLFLYAKSAGLTHLGTKDVWQGESAS